MLERSLPLSSHRAPRDLAVGGGAPSDWRHTVGRLGHRLRDRSGLAAATVLVTRGTKTPNAVENIEAVRDLPEATRKDSPFGSYRQTLGISVVGP
jgi:hypothetical protein